MLNLGKSDRGDVASFISILTTTPSPMLLSVFRLMYPKAPLRDGLDFLQLLTRGLKANEFFKFVQMIRKLSDNGSDR